METCDLVRPACDAIDIEFEVMWFLNSGRECEAVSSVELERSSGCQWVGQECLRGLDRTDASTVDEVLLFQDRGSNPFVARQMGKESEVGELKLCFRGQRTHLKNILICRAYLQFYPAKSTRRDCRHASNLSGENCA